MISHITILTAMGLSVLYPLCFWISAREPLKDNFHRFHLGMPVVIGGVCCAYFLISPFENYLKFRIACWLLGMLFLTFYFWNKETVNVIWVSYIQILGMLIFVDLVGYYLAPGWRIVGISILGAAIFSAILYAMNLGHWYLNVHGLPLKHLKQSTHVLCVLLGVRLVWDAYVLLKHKVYYDGEVIPMIQFIQTLEGFLLYVPLLFGTLLPFLSLYFVYGTIKLKNTQSTTGILYVILCSILIGHIAYQYYLIKFGIVL